MTVARITNATVTSNINDLDEFVESHRTVADVIAHLRTKQGKRIYYSVLNEIRDMALGGDAGESGDGVSIREYYYPHFSNEDFLEVLGGLGEGVNV